MENKKIVYAVRQEWANGDGCETQIDLFDTEEKAQEFYKECVKQEKTEFLTSQHLDENGELEEGYCAKEDTYYYEFYEDGNYSEVYSVIWVEELEVK
jgi:hypothetical protein